MCTLEFPKINDEFRPFDHQIKTCEHIIKYKKSVVLNKPRTGKTASVIWAVHNLFLQDKIDNVLILTTKSTQIMWQEGFLSILPDISITTNLKKYTNHKILILNHDGIKTKLFNQKVHYIFAKKTFFIIDEVIEMGDYVNSKKNKIAKVIASSVEYATILTGSMFTSTSRHAFSALKIIFNEIKWSEWQELLQNRAFFGHEDKKNWRDLIFKHNLIKNYIFYDSNVIKTNFTIVKEFKYIRLDNKIIEVLKELKKENKIKLEKKEITAVNAAAIFTKVKSLSTGVLYDTSELKRNIYFFDITNKINFLKKEIKENDQKTILITTFTESCNYLEKLLSYEYKVLKIYGAIKKRDRNVIIDKFCNNKDYKFLIAHPKTIGHGLELSVANKIIWVSCPNSRETHNQVNMRIQSFKQKSKICKIIYMYSTNIEYAIIKRYLDDSNAEFKLEEKLKLLKKLLLK